LNAAALPAAPAEKRAEKAMLPEQAQLKEQLAARRTQRLAEVSTMQQHAKAMVVSAAAVSGPMDAFEGSKEGMQLSPCKQPAHATTAQLA
jgi:hypothetical protein